MMIETIAARAWHPVASRRFSSRLRVRSSWSLRLRLLLRLQLRALTCEMVRVLCLPIGP